MSTIVTRAGKGSALTHNEVDANFTNLNNDKIEAAQSVTLTNKTLGTGTAITAGTINNAVIGGTTPAAGTFTSLSDSGNLTFTGTGNRITGDFSNATVANRVMFQSSTTNGNTSVPFIPNGTGTISGILLYGGTDTTNTNFLQVLSNGTLNAGINGTGTYQPLTFFTGGSERMRLDTSGNVGIGTSSPFNAAGYGAVTINGTTGGILSLYSNGAETGRVQTTAAATTVQSITSVPLILGTGNTERMRIDSSGNVGIGTSSPGASWRLAVSANNAGMSLQDTGSVGTWFDFKTGSGTVQGNIFYSFTDGYMVFGTAAAGSAQVERLRITSTGTLTSQATYDNTASGSTVVVTSAGLVRRTSSSIKYKKDVETLDAVLASNAVDNLRPVWYRTKNAEGDDKATWSHIGLIAEEVHEVEPRLVRYKTVDVTYDEEGKRVETELATPEPEDVDYARLSVLLLAEVKSLKERIAALENK